MHICRTLKRIPIYIRSDWRPQRHVDNEICDAFAFILSSPNLYNNSKTDKHKRYSLLLIIKSQRELIQLYSPRVHSALNELRIISVVFFVLYMAIEVCVHMYIYKCQYANIFLYTYLRSPVAHISYKHTRKPKAHTKWLFGAKMQMINNSAMFANITSSSV